jgi:4'-phosphopantetheinyl transferase
MRHAPLELGGFPDRPRAGVDEVHVVRGMLDVGPLEVEQLGALLSEDERERAGRFVFERDRRRFTVARGLLRVVLGRYLDAPPGLLRFGTGPHGKPFLLDGGVQFNVSHSGERALIAVSPRREVGIDIELHRPDVEFLALARHSFSASERRGLEALPAAEVAAAFYRCWARKESFIKARGDGLAFPLDGFDVSLEPAPAVALLGCAAAPMELARWRIVPLEIEEGYAAALTVEGEGARIAAFEAPDAPGRGMIDGPHEP